MKFKSQILQQASGSVGGLTYSHNRGGMYTRQRTVPTDPATNRQQAVRNALASIVNAWVENLTSEQRTAWEIYGENVPVQDALGSTINLTGQNWFVGVNVPRIQASLGTISDAPTIFDQGVPPVRILGNTSGLGPEIEFNVNTPPGLLASDIELDSPASADGDVLIYLGPPINPSVNFWKGPYQLAAVAPIADGVISTPWNTPLDELLNDNVALANDQTRPVRLQITYDDGRLSPELRTIATVVDTTV